ncbi:shikimate dehydrogenase [Propylenella binzhouense]|uniref:Shikimate dehydrogenase (NADP(+)) n=1 Tax=Propylenella binzhouense TaxID=2555902 RepID=A0A964T1P5_9HYPH|nr:shikimate dehydrogenase [Propylenella binzhouense]MYZ46823.1 shikimate dehydrogenase [Propylenella binzhouense]
MSMQRAFVAGWPIAHSRSPLIHRYWLRRYGIDGDYAAVAVPPQDARRFFASLSESGYVGGNITLPHKETAWSACTLRTEVAERLGAVNTLWIENGRLAGDNTDLFGFLANLDERAPGWRKGGPAIVLGAGGSSRAVAHGLAMAGFAPVHVLNRTEGRALDLARQLGGPVRGGALAALADLIGIANIIVNTTAAELAGGEPLAIDWSRAKPDALATDIVYTPLETSFLRDAAAAGLRSVDGLGMLLHQARPGFERWFGVRPQVDDTLRRLVLADIEG